MKIAYLIAAHSNYLHLQKLIHALDGAGSTFYLHIDKKSVIPGISGSNIFYITDRVDVHWSGFSQVEATIRLLQRAVQGHHDYYAYISGGDYPVKPNAWLQQTLSGGGEFIQMHRMGEDPYAPLSRYKYYYFTDYYDRRNKRSRRTQFFLWLQPLLRKLKLKKKIPLQLYTGASWFVLSDACVQYVLQQIKNNSLFKRFFKTGFCPDESFFQTIIGNSPFAAQVKGYLTYADWTVDPGPAFISEAHLQVLKSLTGKFFARKFSDDSEQLTGWIDDELRESGTNTSAEVTC